MHTNEPTNVSCLSEARTQRKALKRRVSNPQTISCIVNVYLMKRRKCSHCTHQLKHVRNYATAVEMFFTTETTRKQRSCFCSRFFKDLSISVKTTQQAFFSKTVHKFANRSLQYGEGSVL